MVQRAVCIEEAHGKQPFKQNKWDANSTVDHSELINYTVQGYPVIKQFQVLQCIHW